MGNLAAAAPVDWGAWGNAGSCLTPSSGCPRSGSFSCVHQGIRASLHVYVQPSTPQHALLGQGIAIACWSWKLQLPVAKMLLPRSVSKAASITGAKWAEAGRASSLAQWQPQQSPERSGSCVTLNEEQSCCPWGIHSPPCCMRSCGVCLPGSLPRPLVKRWSTTHTMQYLHRLYLSLKGLT